MNDAYYINLEENYMDDQMKWEIRCEQALEIAHDCLVDIISDMRQDIKTQEATLAYVTFGNHAIEYYPEEEELFCGYFIDEAVQYLTEDWDEQDLIVDITYHDDNYNLI